MVVRPGAEQLVLPRYSFAEADHLAAVSRGTARRWLANGDQLEAVSFLDLVEIAIVGRLKDAGFSAATIRGIVQRCQEILGVAQPFPSLQFKVGGRDVLVEGAGVLGEVGRRTRLLV